MQAPQEGEGQYPSRNPETLLESLLSGMHNSRRVVRVVEQDGQKYFQFFTTDYGYDNNEKDEDTDYSSSTDKDKSTKRGYALVPFFVIYHVCVCVCVCGVRVFFFS